MTTASKFVGVFLLGFIGLVCFQVFGSTTPPDHEMELLKAEGAFRSMKFSYLSDCILAAGASRDLGRGESYGAWSDAMDRWFETVEDDFYTIGKAFDEGSERDMEYAKRKLSKLIRETDATWQITIKNLEYYGGEPDANDFDFCGKVSGSPVTETIAARGRETTLAHTAETPLTNAQDKEADHIKQEIEKALADPTLDDEGYKARLKELLPTEWENAWALTAAKRRHYHLQHEAGLVK